MDTSTLLDELEAALSGRPARMPRPEPRPQGAFQRPQAQRGRVDPRTAAALQSVLRGMPPSVLAAVLGQGAR